MSFARGHDPSAGFGTRDLCAFNRWLAVSRLRAVGGVVVLIGVLQYAHPGAVAWRHALAVSGWSVLFSALVLTADDRTCGTRRFLAVQTLGDLAAVSAGILYGATSPSVGLLLRPLLILVVVPISLLSVPLGLATALGGTITVRSKIGHGTCFAVTLPARWVEVPLAPREPLVAA